MNENGSKRKIALHDAQLQPKPTKFLKSSLLKEREALPIASARLALIAAFRKCTNYVIIGETGSGKTTQVTLYFCFTFHCLLDSSVHIGSRIVT